MRAHAYILQMRLGNILKSLTDVVERLENGNFSLHEAKQ